MERADEIRDLYAYNRWANRSVLDAAGRLSPEELARDLGSSFPDTGGRPYENPLWQLLRHLINHATYHRGQVTTMLRQLGAVAVATDLVVYLREHGA